MKKTILLIVLLMLFSSTLIAQVSINTDNSAPDPSAILDVKSTTKGALLPRMTQEEISEISNPANGLQVFCTTDSKMYIYVVNVGQWKEIAYSTGTITPITTCGSITINHLTSGGVAPVDKTVTYGTVSNIPGEPNKCWLTSNLGADHIASAVNDTTEASSGWYWQFNLKQGYKLADDRTTRTPNTTWISSISENSDWTPVNDPCAIELGGSWRIPTYTEWYNVKTIGGWNAWSDPWLSGLKMHLSGYLDKFTGLLYSRGGSAYRWSSTQADNGGSYGLGQGAICYLDYNPKSWAFSLRCIRER